MTNGLSPFLKWAGGKRWALESLTEGLPSEFARYFEPFLGGGALFFRLRPSNALLSDINDHLISAYAAIRSDWRLVASSLQWFHDRHGRRFYYEQRAKRYEDQHWEAARFIYLNRSCWNGLYRENCAGVFNVPIGTKQNIVLPTDNFEETAAALAAVELQAVDFEEAIDQAGEGDLIYADPPYTTAHNFNGFAKYNQKIFSWEDQVRLRDALVRASARGAMAIVSNAGHASIRDLYADFKHVRGVTRKSVIAAAAARRNTVEELVIRTF